MKVGTNNQFDLAYCTKIHPANGWHELSTQLQDFVPKLKKDLSPAGSFGLALRLSDRESRELLEPENIESFRNFLADQDSYVFTINGFPFGSFHSQPVKARIFAPDWREDSRVEYTLRLIEILHSILPGNTEGSISTLPLSYRSWINPAGQEEAMKAMVHNLLKLVERMIRIRNDNGPFIHLDIEPEPDGLLQDCHDFVSFYQRWLLSYGATILKMNMGIPLSAARDHIRNHIQLCLDTCHLAVSYEDPEEIISLLAQEDIKIGKVQIASGLRVLFHEIDPDSFSLAQCLQEFCESRYLHQVITRTTAGTSQYFPDLCTALPHLPQDLPDCLPDFEEIEWRIHYHMPLFIDTYRMIRTTQSETRKALNVINKRQLTRHLEIETYTWEQLPSDLKINLHDSLKAEYQWVFAAFAA